MKYALDAEFIDTPECSALISMALVGEDGREIYWEFDYPKEHLTPWLKYHVVPHLKGTGIRSFSSAAVEIVKFMEGTEPKIWCYYGAYDWYWFCRLFGGMMQLPETFETLFHEFREFGSVGGTNGLRHMALQDARDLMEEVNSMFSGMPRGRQ